MANWHYYNENREKIGPVTGTQLKQLVREGTVTPETFIEDPTGRTGLAKDVKGLPFHKMAQPETMPSEASPVPLPPSADANPFIAVPPVAENPFVVQAAQEAMPQSVPMPIAEGKKIPPRLITLAGILVLLVVVGIGSTMLSRPGVNLANAIDLREELRREGGAFSLLGRSHATWYNVV